MIGSARIKRKVIIARALAAIAAVIPALGGIILATAVAAAVSDPFSILHETLFRIDYDGGATRVQTEETEGTVVGPFLGVTSVRRVFVTGVLTAISQVVAAGFGVVRCPGVAGTVAEVVGFFDAASR